MKWLKARGHHKIWCPALQRVPSACAGPPLLCKWGILVCKTSKAEAT